MPKTLVGCHERRHDRVAAVRFWRDTQENEFQRYKQIAGDVQFAFVTRVIECGLYLVAQPAAVAFLIR